MPLSCEYLAMEQTVCDHVIISNKPTRYEVHVVKYLDDSV